MSHPAAMEATSDHIRQRCGARRPMTTVTATTMSVMAGPAAAGASAGTSRIRPTPSGRTDTEISMMTVPDTTGVMTRRSSGSQKANIR